MHHFFDGDPESCVIQGEENVHEIIVIDDQSEDDTLALAQHFAKAHPQFDFVIETSRKKGACAARNRAYALATGEAIQWLDADDILGPNKLRTQLELLKINPNHLVASKWRRFEGDLTNMHPEEGGNWTDVWHVNPIGVAQVRANDDSWGMAGHA